MKNNEKGKPMDSYLDVISMLEEKDGSVFQTASLLNEGEAEVQVME